MRLLLCRYQDGEGHFSCDSISTLAIIRDVITQRATLQKQRMSISFHANEDTVPHFCHLIFPRLQVRLPMLLLTLSFLLCAPSFSLPQILSKK